MSRLASHNLVPPNTTAWGLLHRDTCPDAHYAGEGARSGFSAGTEGLRQQGSRSWALLGRVIPMSGPPARVTLLGSVPSSVLPARLAARSGQRDGLAAACGEGIGRHRRAYDGKGRGRQPGGCTRPSAAGGRQRTERRMCPGPGMPEGRGDNVINDLAMPVAIRQCP